MSLGQTRIAAAWRTFSAAPHRMFFFTGMWQLVAVSAWWAFVLVMRATGTPVEPVLPALFVHGGMFLFLVVTPFMAGFLFTVFPRWQPAPEIPRSIHLTVFAAFNLGQLAFLAGMYASRLLLVAALALLALGWAALLGGLILSLARARQRVVHAWGVLFGLLGGFAGLLLFLYSVTSNDWQAWALVRGLGIWAFLLPVYFTVSHRMVPFFTSRVVQPYTVFRPDALFWLGLGLAILRGLLELAPAYAWLASTPLAMILVSLSWKWWPRVPYDNALLRVLHLSLLWLAGGVLLYAIQDAALAFAGDHVLGRAPLHALGIGFFGGMLISMVTRVSLGHSGRPLVLDPFTWLIFCIVQFAVLARIAAEFVHAGGWLMALAGLAWFAAFVAWARKFIAVYWRPRVDGAAG